MTVFSKLAPSLKGRPPMKSSKWLDPEKEVWKTATVSGSVTYWKALDIEIPGGDGYRQLSSEVEVLNLMIDRPGFPYNWWTERSNWHRWLVRYPALRVPEDYEPFQMAVGDVLELEQSLRELNGLGWSIGLGRAIEVMVDPESFSPFFVGLSGAVRVEGADDEDSWLVWLGDNEFDELVTLRAFGRAHALSRYGHVYAALSRPVVHKSLLPEEAVIHGVGHKIQLGSGISVWNAVVLPRGHEPLSADVIKAYELTWAWSPIEYKVEQ